MTESKSLSSLITKERPFTNHSRFLFLKKSVVSDSVMILANRSSNLLQKTSDSLQKSILSMFLTVFPLLMPKEQIAPVALCSVAPFKERRERFAFADLYKRATVSNSLRSLMTKEWWERFALFHQRIAFSLSAKN